MATYYSDRVRSDATHPVQANNGLVVDFCEVSVGTALVGSDIVKLFTVPKNARVLSVLVAGYGIQSGTDSVYTVGDAGDTDRFVTIANGLNLRSNNASQNLGMFSIDGATTGIGHKYTADTDVNLTITTAGTGMTTGGKIHAAIFYFIVD